MKKINIPYPLTRTTAITDELLINAGFKQVEVKDGLNRIVWRLDIPFYPKTIQFVMGDYPSTNPNCGVVSIYSPERESIGYNNDGRKKTYRMPEITMPIAYYVNTFERLRTIILSLSETNI